MAKKQDIRRYSADELRDRIARGEDHTDWARIDGLTDAEVEAAIADDVEQQSLEWDWANAEVVMPSVKEQVSLRLDPDVLAFFKRGGRGYQTRINAVLRVYMQAHLRDSADH